MFLIIVKLEVQHSLNFVAANHLVWEMEPPKKRSKRYGNLVKSPAKGLDNMLAEHHATVQQLITSKIKEGTGKFVEAVKD